MASITIQDIFDKERKNNNRIIQLEEELIMLKDELKSCKKNVKIFKKQRQELQINLLKDKKLVWVECNLNEWREYVEKNEDDPVKYYMYYYDGGISQQGYFKGEYKLDENDSNHFEEYINDYFYYGYPYYQDHNDPCYDGSECYLAFGSGDAYIKSFEWD